MSHVHAVLATRIDEARAPYISRARRVAIQLYGTGAGETSTLALTDGASFMFRFYFIPYIKSLPTPGRCEPV